MSKTSSISRTFLSAWCFLLALEAKTASAADSAQVIPPPPEIRVQIEASLAAPSPIPLSGDWFFHSLDGGEDVRHPVGSPRVVLPPETRWEVSLVAPGFWAARQTTSFRKENSEEKLSFVVWPLGAVEGTLVAADRQGLLPKTLEVAVLLPLKEGKNAPRGRSGCELLPLPADPKKLLHVGFRCLLPATSLDLSFQPQGYAPFYRRGLEVSAKEPRRLGPISLREGGSIVGWVTTEGGRLLGQPEISIEPALGPKAGTPQQQRSLASTGRTAPIAEGGSFEFVALSPGSYTLRLEPPGFSPFRSAPVEVFAGVQTLLQEPVVLRAPVDLEVEILPTTDPHGKAWQLQLIRSQDAGATADFEGATDGHGLARVGLLDAGQYLATIADSEGNEYWAEPRFEVVGPGLERKTVEIKTWLVKGKVLRKASPVAASIWFGGKLGFQQVRTESDAEGEFELALPRLGKWRVEVEWSEAGVREAKLDVEVLRHGEGRGKVDVEIPSARVYGMVVEADGRAVANGVEVVGRNARRSVRVTTNERGEFTFDGLREGPWEFEAVAFRSGSSRTSDRMERAVGENQEIGPLTLTLRGAERWKGRVESPQGPVAGATVSLMAWRPLPGAGSQGRTDLDGSFDLALPASTTGALATVEAPGFGLRSVVWEPALGPLRVSTDRGDLLIHLPTRLVEGNELLPSLTQDGIPLLLTTLDRWAALFGEPLVPFRETVRIPSLSPGAYRLCLVRGGQTMPEAEPGTRCAEGLLTVGGVVELDLRDRDETNAR